MLDFLLRLVHKDLLTYPLGSLPSSMFVEASESSLDNSLSPQKPSPETVQTNLESLYIRLYPFTFKVLKKHINDLPKF